MLSLLSHLFVTERHRPRKGDREFATPTLSEIEVDDPTIEPLLATNMRGTFLPTKISSQGYARFGYSPCTPDEEVNLIKELHRVLVEVGIRREWNNTAHSVPEALDKMTHFGVIARVVIVARGAKPDVAEGFPVIEAGLDEGCALLLATAPRCGLYTRIQDHAGLLIYRANTSFIPVIP